MGEREMMEVMALTALGGVCRVLLPDGGVGRTARFVLGVLLLTAAVSLFLPGAEKVWEGSEARSWYAAGTAWEMPAGTGE